MSTVRATTGQTGHRLVCGFDITLMRPSDVGTLPNVWAIETEEVALYKWVQVNKVKQKKFNYRPVLGDLAGSRFEILADRAIRDGNGHRDRVFLRAGSRVSRITVNKKEYLLFSGLVYIKNATETQDPARKIPGSE